MVRLLQHDVGASAQNDLELLEDVIALKSAFYNSATAQYGRYVSGELNLIPDQDNFPRLEDDYYAMERSGMLNGHIYPLRRVMEDLSSLQEHVNRLVLGRG
jgi:hypothetical protein